MGIGDELQHDHKASLLREVLTYRTEVYFVGLHLPTDARSRVGPRGQTLGPNRRPEHSFWLFQREFFHSKVVRKEPSVVYIGSSA